MAKKPKEKIYQTPVNNMENKHGLSPSFNDLRDFDPEELKRPNSKAFIESEAAKMPPVIIRKWRKE